MGIASLVCPAGHGVLRLGPGAIIGKHEETGGRGWLPVSCVLAVLLGLVLESVPCGGVLF